MWSTDVMFQLKEQLDQSVSDVEAAQAKQQLAEQQKDDTGQLVSINACDNPLSHSTSDEQMM